MNNVITFPNTRNTINMTALRQSASHKLAAGMILPAAEEYTPDIAPDHAADPIKSMDDIERIASYLLEQKRWRDYMLFIVGINFGLRASDLRELRFADLINDNFTFKDTFAVFEKKTRNTRKRKRNRYITINQAVIEAVTLYLEHTPGVCLSDYLFRSESNHGGNENKPLDISNIYRILKKIGEDLDLGIQMSTHTLRKTFCYHQMVMSQNDPRKLLLLQKMLGHSSTMQTLTYIGLTREEMEAAYKNLNLGSKGYNYLRHSDIVEREAIAV